MTLGLALLLACPVGAQASQRGEQSGGRLTAVLVGPDSSETAIALLDVAKYDCHDLARPVIRCFVAAATRNQDASLYASVLLSALDVDPAASLELPLGATSVTYAIVYDNQNYGGSSFLIASVIPDLAVFGWSNRISSLKSTNGGHPKFWPDANYGGSPQSQWPVSAWVPYVGDGVNDTFTSVKNVP